MSLTVKDIKKPLRKGRDAILDVVGFFQLSYLQLTGKKYIRAHYSREKNFGDLFNKDLVSYFDRRLVYSKSPLKSEMALTGSILQAYPREFHGFIMGSGFIKEQFVRDHNHWKVKIIRGPLSAKQCEAGQDVLYGDPGVLASILYSETIDKKYDLGIVPHYMDKQELTTFKTDMSIKIINVNQAPSIVAREIKQCKNIASSSLHGLIFADAFRIPNIHLKISDRLLGGLHKFNDYYLGMNATPEYLTYRDTLRSSEIIEACRLRYSNSFLEEKQRDMISIFKETLEEIE